MLLSGEVGCPLCHGEGWIIDPDPDNRAYYECKCRRAYQNNKVNTQL